MLKAMGCWLFGLGIVIDIPVIVLKCIDWISWSWWIIAGIPFAVSIVGTVIIALIMGLIGLFVLLATWGAE